MFIIINSDQEKNLKEKILNFAAQKSSYLFSEHFFKEESKHSPEITILQRPNNEIKKKNGNFSDIMKLSNEISLKNNMQYLFEHHIFQLN